MLRYLLFVRVQISGLRGVTYFFMVNGCKTGMVSGRLLVLVDAMLSKGRSVMPQVSERSVTVV